MGKKYLKRQEANSYLKKKKKKKYTKKLSLSPKSPNNVKTLFWYYL